jgi:hypothetical protein
MYLRHILLRLPQYRSNGLDLLCLLRRHNIIEPYHELQGLFMERAELGYRLFHSLETLVKLYHLVRGDLALMSCGWVTVRLQHGTGLFCDHPDLFLTIRWTLCDPHGSVLHDAAVLLGYPTALLQDKA